MEVGYSDKTYKARIGLMYVSDYGYAAYQEAWTINLEYDSNGVNGYNNADIIENNGMLIKSDEWTITRIANFSNRAFYVISPGHVDYNKVSSHFGVRI